LLCIRDRVKGDGDQIWRCHSQETIIDENGKRHYKCCKGRVSTKNIPNPDTDATIEVSWIVSEEIILVSCHHKNNAILDVVRPSIPRMFYTTVMLAVEMEETPIALRYVN
jgi:hypothetical protein